MNLDLNTIGLLFMGAAFGACVGLAAKLAWDDWREGALRRAQEKALLRQAETDITRRPRVWPAKSQPTLWRAK